MRSVKNILDKDFQQVAISNLWRLLSGPLLLLLIPVMLSESEQGYWFTFMALSAFVMLADMGFSNIVLQFAAHERAHLIINNDGAFSGKLSSLEKLSALYGFSQRLLNRVALIIGPVIFATGVLVFDNLSFSVVSGWGLYLLGSIIYLRNNLLLAFFEGCDKVAETHAIRRNISVVSVAVSVLLLISNAGLNSLVASQLIAALYGYWAVKRRYTPLVYQLKSLVHKDSYNWLPILRPLMVKYAVSWTSGYVTMSLFVPVSMALHGAEFSGKIGLTWAIFSNIFSLSVMWVTAVLPKINMSISRYEFDEVDILIRNRLMLCLSTYVFGVIVFAAVYQYFDIIAQLKDRFLAAHNMFLVGVIWFFQIIINTLALHARSFKKEPYYKPSVFLAVYVLVTTLYIASNYGEAYIFLGLISSFIWWLPVFYYVTRKSINSSKLEMLG